jgi:signal peptidase I
MKRKLFFLVTIVISAASLMLLFAFDLVRVRGNSMEPTYCDNSLLIMQRVGRLTGPFEPVIGQSVVAKMNSDSQVIKRVVAVSGDTVRILNGLLERNHHFVDEPYVCSENVNPYQNWPRGADILTVPANSVFLLGDDRVNSRDSQDFGSISKDKIFGVVKGQIWRGNGCKC